MDDVNQQLRIKHFKFLLLNVMRFSVEEAFMRSKSEKKDVDGIRGVFYTYVLEERELAHISKLACPS